MNYTKMLLNTIGEFNEENSDDTKNLYTVKAKELIKAFLTIRFNNELKQYNNDKEKVYDKFIAERSLTLLNCYIEEFYLLDKDVTQEELSIRKKMRQINHHLRNKFNQYE